MSAKKPYRMTPEAPPQEPPTDAQVEALATWLHEKLIAGMNWSPAHRYQWENLARAVLTKYGPPRQDEAVKALNGSNWALRVLLKRITAKPREDRGYLADVETDLIEAVIKDNDNTLAALDPKAQP